MCINSMCKIHPAASVKAEDAGPTSSVWTVWKRSSMTFQGTDGFSVYNNEGKLAFRVDNYSRKHKELVLMDGEGKALLLLRPQVLSMHDQWNGFKCEDDAVSGKTQMFSMRRRRSFLLQNRSEIEIIMNDTIPEFKIEGSFSRRSCKIQNKSGDVVAEISRKTVNKSVVLSDDVFSLVVCADANCSLIMAFVVVMDRICPKPFTRIMCS